MAANMYKKYSENLTREWRVVSSTQVGDAVLNLESEQPGVALTSRGDATRPAGIPGVTGGTMPNGGVGNKSNAATVATDGSWLFAVTGATNGDTVDTGAGTAEGTKVYAVVSSGEVTSLTLTAASNKFYGVIDAGVIVDGVAPVKIGVNI